MCIRPIASSIPPLTRMAANKKGSENIHSTKSSRDTLVDGIIKMLRKCSASTCSMHVCMLVTLVVRRCRATKSTCRYTKTHSNTDSLSLSLLSPPPCAPRIEAAQLQGAQLWTKDTAAARKYTYLCIRHATTGYRYGGWLSITPGWETCFHSQVQAFWLVYFLVADRSLKIIKYILIKNSK